eukprot:3387781-Rhodomonas_salina.2
MRPASPLTRRDSPRRMAMDPLLPRAESRAASPSTPPHGRGGSSTPRPPAGSTPWARARRRRGAEPRGRPPCTATPSPPPQPPLAPPLSRVPLSPALSPPLAAHLSRVNAGWDGCWDQGDQGEQREALPGCDWPRRRGPGRSRAWRRGRSRAW